MAVASVRPTTATGAPDNGGSVLPVPRLPSEFTPQQKTVPFGESAHVWLVPAVTATASRTPEAGLMTRSGMPVDVVDPLVPRPSCPLELLPQHQTLLSSRAAQVCDPPVVTACT